MSPSTSSDHLHLFCNPVKILSGRNALEHLPVELGSHDAVRPMVVVHKSKGLRRRLRRLLSAFRDSGMTLVVYDHLAPEADLEGIKPLAALFHDAGCDALLAMGYGRLLHQVKALRLFAQHHALSETPVGGSGEASSDEASSEETSSANGTTTQGAAGLPDPDPPDASARIPLFWLPTGPGAGDELGGHMAMEGQPLTHPGLRPQVACIDKRLLDPSDWDHDKRDGLLDRVLLALVNAVEVCLESGDNPFAVAYAEAVIKTLAESLTPEGLEASRADILLTLTNAAVWSDCARNMQAPGLAHRLGRVLATKVDLGAGLLMALCLPAVVDGALVGATRLSAELLHLLGGAELYSLTEAHLQRPKCVNLLSEGWRTLCENWPGDLPGDLQATGLVREALPEMAGAADQADPHTALKVLEQSWTMVPAVQLQALPKSPEAPAHSQNTLSQKRHADGGAQDAPAELL
jgi:alcohol dehydrogenase